MAFGNYSPRIRRGQSWTLAGTIKLSGSAVSLVGATAYLAVNTWPKSTGTLYYTTSITLGGAAGTFSVTVPRSATVTWPSNGPDAITNRLVYDLVITLADTSVVNALSGEVIVEEVAG